MGGDCECVRNLGMKLYQNVSYGIIISLILKDN